MREKLIIAALATSLLSGCSVAKGIFELQEKQKERIKEKAAEASAEASYEAELEERYYYFTPTLPEEGWTDRQKRIMAQVDIDESDVSDSQEGSLNAIEITLQYLEEKYPNDSFSYSGYFISTGGYSGDYHLYAETSNADKVGASCFYNGEANGEYKCIDNYDRLIVRDAYQEELSAFIEGFAEENDYWDGGGYYQIVLDSWDADADYISFEDGYNEENVTDYLSQSYASIYLFFNDDGLTEEQIDEVSVKLFEAMKERGILSEINLYFVEYQDMGTWESNLFDYLREDGNVDWTYTLNPDGGENKTGEVVRREGFWGDDETIYPVTEESLKPSETSDTESGDL